MKLFNIGLLISVVLSGCATNNAETETAAPQQQPMNTLLEASEKFQQHYKQKFNSQNLTEISETQEQQKQNASSTDDATTLVKHAIAALESLTQNQSSQASIPSQQHDINFYVRGLMQDLVANLQYVNAKTPVAVVSFVMLDSDYNQANLLGIQLSESLIHEIHKFGIPVIDFKTTGFIRITEQGDFAFSKDYQDFTNEIPARYIVGGTMLKNADGYLINARIVGVKSQAVVASAQSLIPYDVANPILNPTTDSEPSALNASLQLGSIPPVQNFNSQMDTNNQSTEPANAMQGSRSNSVSLIQK